MSTNMQTILALLIVLIVAVRMLFNWQKKQRDKSSTCTCDKAIDKTRDH